MFFNSLSFKYKIRQEMKHIVLVAMDHLFTATLKYIPCYVESKNSENVRSSHTWMTND